MKKMKKIKIQKVVGTMPAYVSLHQISDSFQLKKLLSYFSSGALPGDEQMKWIKMEH